MSPDTVSKILDIDTNMVLYSPPGSSDIELMKEANHRGSMGILDLEYLEMEEIKECMSELSDPHIKFGVRLDPMSDKLQALMTGDIPSGLEVIVSVPKEGIPAMVRSGVYDTAKQMGMKIFQEVCGFQEADDAEQAGADALVLRPFEGGGRVSSMSLREITDRVSSVVKDIPILARGGFSEKDIGKGPFSGFVLDQEVLGRDHLPERVKDRSKEVSVITLLRDMEKTMRFIAGDRENKHLLSLVKDMENDGADQKTIYKTIKSEVGEMVASTMKGDSLLYPAGNGALEDGKVSLDSVLPDRKGKPDTDNLTGLTVNEKEVGPDYHDGSIAIVGMGTVFPRGIGKENYWKMIMEGVDACTEVPKERWDWRLHYDPDPSVTNKTYSKIGAFVTNFQFDTFSFKIPPKVSEQFDLYQKFGLVATREALQDAGILDDEQLDRSRVGVIMANSAGGENRDWAVTRINFEEIHQWMKETDIWKEIPQNAREKLYKQTRQRVNDRTLNINEDTMPGSLPNIGAGRLANAFNFRGPNYITDAACGSSLAAIMSARNHLMLGQIDAAVSGGLESLMSTHGYVEFCKIGALTPDGSRPYSEGANGFLMGEGSGVLVLKRLEDAVEAGDRIYAVIRGIGGSSDGKGKGITAPNPAGQRLAVQRGLEDADIEPSTISFIEGHGTSTAVGDVAEVNSLVDIFGGLPERSIGLTSIKSQIGHLKSAAGAAGIIKAALAIHNRVIPKQINFTAPNPYIDWEKLPFYVVTESREWERIKTDIPRRCGVSAFGFGGTNFHVVLEEFDENIYRAWKESRDRTENGPQITEQLEKESGKNLEGPRKIDIDEQGILEYMEEHGDLEGEAFLFSSDNPMDLLKQAKEAHSRASGLISRGGRLRDAVERPSFDGRYRLGIVVEDLDHFEKQLETLTRIGFNEKALMALAAKGIFVGDLQRMDRGKTCMMFPGQGSQYINMFRDLKNKYSIVKETFEEADRVMSDLIERPLSSYVFADVERGTPEFKEASEMLRQTEYNQPSMLTVDTAMYKLISKLGVEPDVVMGHSLGEYGALIASGIMKFGDALRAVSARGKEMKDLEVDDPGKMASVMAGLDVVQEVIDGIDGYVIPANKNCLVQTVIAGESDAVDRALEKFKEKGVDAVQIPVSHAFHSEVVAPAKEPLRKVLSSLEIKPPSIPVLSNVTSDYYPIEGSESEIKAKIVDLLKEQVAHSVEWIGEVRRAYEDGCRTFIEVGPKRALTGFAYNLMEEDVKKGRVYPVTSNHPKKGGIRTFNEMIASLWSVGHDLRLPSGDDTSFYREEFVNALDKFVKVQDEEEKTLTGESKEEPEHVSRIKPDEEGFESFLRDNSDLIRDFLGKVYRRMPAQGPGKEPPRRDVDLSGTGASVPPRKGVDVVVTGAAMGLPGRFKDVFDENNMGYLVEGRNLIGNIREDYLERFIDKHIVRLDKKPDGSAEMVKLDDPDKVVKLSGKLGSFDPVREFGIPDNLDDVLDITTELAFAAGLLALKDAGIPMVKRYSQTSTGSFLPEEWELPLELQEDTGIVFASAFPGTNNLIDELSAYFEAKMEKARGEEKEKLYRSFREKVDDTDLLEKLDAWYENKDEGGGDVTTYDFPRLFMFKVLAMGHSQFAQYIKAKGPNTQVNSACASSTLAASIAQDWIQAGRCKRVLVLGADDPASDTMIEWFGSSLLAMGALTPESDVTRAALPFDRRRKGMIIGSGVSALLMESAEEPRRRGMNPIVQVLGSHIGNSAFHGSRLDIAHIARSMDGFITRMEKEWDIDRDEMAPDMVFMSHETYTPARGGSSAAEVESLRRTFGDRYEDILIMNTKGYTGHAFGACIEDPVLVRSLETGLAVPLANFTPNQTDPQFEGLQLSDGGKHDRHYGLRIAAGFGSQLAFLLVRRPDVNGRFFDQKRYRSWLRSVATTEPVELETVKNVLRLRDQGRDCLIRTRAIKRDSSAIGYRKKKKGEVEDEVFREYKKKVLEIFSERTSFPLDTIDIDADLETEMGIDTVKQVELFGSARIAFDLPKDEGVNLREYPTLRDVINYIILKKGSREVEDTGTVTHEPPKTEEKKEGKEERSSQKVGMSRDEVAEKVVSIVAEKTGYPRDMLEPDLDLEADLGIDTVKQVELFGDAREQFDLPRDDSVNLTDFNTLDRIIDYVVERSPSAHEDEFEEPSGEEPSRETDDDIRDKVISIVAEKTGYPEDMLELDLDLEADLGIDTVKQVELFGEARERFDLPRDDSVNLADFNTLQKIIDYVREMSGATGTEGTTETEESEEPEKIEEAKGPVRQKKRKSDDIQERVISIVAEKTGYPEDMLELDLDLEADLGIDTVKQVELFGEARERFGLPRDDSVNLSDYNTLQKIIDYVREMSGATGSEEPSVTEEMKETESTDEDKEPLPQKEQGFDDIQERVISIVAEKTGYPEDMLELDLDLEADLGIDTVKQVELFGEARERFDLPRDDSVNLSDYNTLRKIIEFVRDNASRKGEIKKTSKPVEEKEEDPGQEDEMPGEEDHREAVKEKVISLVAEKTGYPEDMLELDLDLEADLGIDTVKQVELFGEARTEFGLPRDDSVNLSDLPTLGHIIDFVVSSTLEAPQNQPQKDPKEENLSEDDLKDRVNRWVLQTDRMEDLPRARSKPLKGKRLLLISENGDDEKTAKESLGCDITRMNPDRILEGEIETEGIDGILNLYPLSMTDDPYPDLDRESSRAVRTMFRAAKAMDPVLKKGGFFAALTSMGGSFGIHNDVNPVNGAVSGFTKALSREYPDSKVIAMDVTEGIEIKDALDHLADEVAADHNITEVGFDGENRYRPVLRIVEPASPELLELRDGMRVLVSGGGSGITSEIVKELSGKADLDIHILGRTSVTRDVERFASMSDEELEKEKDRITEELRAGGVRVTPVRINREFKKITKSVAVHRLIREIESTGSSATYHSVDVTDIENVKIVAREAGLFDVVIHAAGVELSKLISGKKEEDFDLVYNTKVLGARALMEATRDHPLKLFLSFSSIAGRAGNGGQVDYSAANDLLDKLHGAVRSIHPDCRVKAVGWSAWADVGMASRGSVKTILEMGGVKFIPPDKGVEMALDEIRSGWEREVFYTGSMGPLDDEGTMKWKEGIHSSQEFPPPVKEKDDSGVEEKNHPESPLIDRVVERTETTIRAVKVLDVGKELFLKDHSIMGKPVLPGVMGIEIFAEAAKLLRPEMDIVGAENISFEKAVNVDGELEITVEASIEDDDEQEKRVSASIRSLDPKKGNQITHFRGTILLGKGYDACRIQEGHPLRPELVKARISREEIYEHLFHGQLFQVTGAMDILGSDQILGLFRSPEGHQFSEVTPFTNDDLVTTPLQTELGFQLAGAYALDRFDMMALPVEVERIDYSSMMDSSENAHAWVHFRGEENNVFTFDVDIIDTSGNVRFAYRGFRLKGLMSSPTEFKGEHSVDHEEIHSPLKEIRAFRLDCEASPGDDEIYRNMFTDDEWEGLFTDRMTEKRRREHLLGRVISKLSVSWYLSSDRSTYAALKSISIETEEDGKPYALVDGERIEISISHSHRWAVCTVSKKIHGSDIELSEPRDRSFAEEAFHPSEMKLLERVREETDLDEPLAQTMLFSAKEAYLKMKGIGLRGDLREIICSEILRSPASTGLRFELILNHREDEFRVEAHIASAYVLTVCSS